MPARLTADQARAIRTQEKATRSPSLRSKLWEKHKQDVLLSAINGGTNYLVIGRDANLIPKLDSLNLDATEIFRNSESEEKYADLEEQCGDILDEQETCLRALRKILTENIQFVTAWEYLESFLDWTKGTYFDEIQGEFGLFDLQHGLEGLPTVVSSNIRKLLSLESDLLEISEIMEGLENEIEDSPLPKGAEYGVMISWSSDFLTMTETVTNRISLPLLCWLSSESGQSSINEIENRIKASIAKRKKACRVDIAVGGEQTGQNGGSYFPSVEVFRLAFETLGYSVQDEQAETHAAEQRPVASLVVSWA